MPVTESVEKTRLAIFRATSRVGVELTLFVLAAILLSWILSSAFSYYQVTQELRVLRRAMLARPDLYPMPIPEPRYRLIDFLLGPQQAFTRETPPPRPQQPTGRQPGQGDGRGQFVPEMGAPAPGNARGMQPPQAFGMPPDGGPPPNGARPRPELQPRAANRPHWASNLLMRGTIALLLAAGAGLFLGRRFSRPLGELAKGARAYQHGHFQHRIPLRGSNEFSEVAGAMNGMARQVAQQIATLKDDAARRQRLLADVAHELRGPVMTLRTMTGALEDGLAEDAERRSRAVQSLARASDRLLHLVTDLLQLARLDLHELPIHRQPVDACALTASCVQAHLAAAAAAGQTLHEMEPGPPQMVLADPDRLAQVLDNLLNNAISHAGPGADIAVTVSGDNPVRIVVSDTGRGISPAHQPFVFDSFYRVDAARSPKDAHSGLGLRIARGLIEAHGGTLTLQSEEGRGARLIITLPRLDAGEGEQLYIHGKDG